MRATERNRSTRSGRSSGSRTMSTSTQWSRRYPKLFSESTPRTTRSIAKAAQTTHIAISHQTTIPASSSGQMIGMP